LLLPAERPEFSQADPEVIGKAVALRDVGGSRNALEGPLVTARKIAAASRGGSIPDSDPDAN
jgi:hypothetical protein